MDPEWLRQQNYRKMRARDVLAAGGGYILGTIGVLAGFLGMVIVGGAIIYVFTLLLAAVYAVLTGQAT